MCRHRGSSSRCLNLSQGVSGPVSTHTIIHHFLVKVLGCAVRIVLHRGGSYGHQYPERFAAILLSRRRRHRDRDRSRKPALIASRDALPTSAMLFDPVLDESFARDCGMMLRMSLRDPRVSKAVQVAFVAMSALWLVNFSTQKTHSTLSWVLLPLNIVVLVGFLFLLLRDIWKPTA